MVVVCVLVSQCPGYVSDCQCVPLCTVGVWDMRGKQFHKGVEIHSWTLVIFGTYRQCPEDRLRYVCGGGREEGWACLEKKYCTFDKLS